MEKLLKEIIDGKKAYEDFLKERKKAWQANKQGKGSKQYIIRRIDMLREQLLDLKKELLKWNYRKLEKY